MSAPRSNFPSPLTGWTEARDSVHGCADLAALLPSRSWERVSARKRKRRVALAPPLQDLPGSKLPGQVFPLPQGERSFDSLTSQEIALATGGTASADFTVTGVAFDSREIMPGDLFIAMRGEETDGHRFIDRAVAAGAAGMITEQPIVHPHVLVADSAAALTALGRAARDRSHATIIGVTGSAGKTGTKEALFHALDRMAPGSAHRSVKSYNNHVGVPLSLARMPRDARFGVFEMGMNHSGELAVLTRIVRPHIAIITTIAPAHIGNFANGEEGIADAKAEIFQGLEPGGTAILPHDNRHFPRLHAAAKACTDTIVRFGSQPDSEARLIDSISAIEGGSLVTAQIGEARLCFRIAAPGEHWVMNALAVMAAVDAAGGDLAIAGLALANLPGLSGRGERLRIATPTAAARC